MNEVIGKEYSTIWDQLMTGAIRPKEIVGGGYKHPKSVASAWLLNQIHQYPDNRELIVTRSGMPYRSIESAERSEAFQQLRNNEFKLVTNKFVVDQYGVCPTDKGGFAVFFTTKLKEG